ncbi:sporulation protein YqfC [Thermoflavimicrobium dichotomicum]|uniref:Sporulation protein YqfC n=1 Tax=Thermoflavimicrobium dichotomicum TaxID=46223 RepID=A0A1I3NI42_9BACL|nr:sporulation protein YqfC [Thermoflavimicrobium dichotomicum]SFJ08941.1 sporulation protein YqfC [Thermoflavimicrobium dichotomicum]
MKRIGKKNMRKWISEWFDLPPDVAEEVPRLEMIGLSHLQVENHRGVLSFSPQELKLRMTEGYLTILGDHLKIKAITSDMVWVEGKMKGLKYTE